MAALAVELMVWMVIWMVGRRMVWWVEDSLKT